MTDRQAPLSDVDPQIRALINQEVARQEHGLELIASENFVSTAVAPAVLDRAYFLPPLPEAR